MSTQTQKTIDALQAEVQKLRNEVDPNRIRKPYQPDLERVVGHFLYYLSNEPDPKTGISPRTRFYGELPIEAKMLFPDVSNEILHNSVDQVIALRQRQINPLVRHEGSWRTA